MAASISANVGGYRGDRRGGLSGGQRQNNRNNYPQSGNQRIRRSNNSPHHYQSPISHHQSQNPHQQDAQAHLDSFSRSERSVYKNENCVRAIMHMIGQRVVLTALNNAKYEGILSAVSPEMDVELKQARRMSSDGGPPTSREQIDSVVFKSKDIQTCQAPNLDTRTLTSSENRPGEFQTDAAISRKQNGTDKETPMRPMVPFFPEGDDVPGVDMSLSGGRGEGWDPEEMFRTNERRFNVETDYDESMRGYTTDIPTSLSREERERAAHLAREIESNPKHRSQMDVENSDDVDEETLHSAVVRVPPEAPAPAPVSAAASAAQPSSSTRTQTYVPPGRRQQQQQQQQMQNQSPSQQPGGGGGPSISQGPSHPGHQYQEGHGGGGGVPPPMGSRGGPGPQSNNPNSYSHRDRRMDRDRGGGGNNERNHHDPRDHHERMSSRGGPPMRNPQNMGPHPPPPQVHSSPSGLPPQNRDIPDRMADRRPDGMARGGGGGGYPMRSQGGNPTDGATPPHPHMTNVNHAPNTPPQQQQAHRPPPHMAPPHNHFMPMLAQQGSAALASLVNQQPHHGGGGGPPQQPPPPPQGPPMQGQKPHPPGPMPGPGGPGPHPGPPQVQHSTPPQQQQQVQAHAHGHAPGAQVPPLQGAPPPPQVNPVQAPPPHPSHPPHPHPSQGPPHQGPRHQPPPPPTSSLPSLAQAVASPSSQSTPPPPAPPPSASVPTPANAPVPTQPSGAQMSPVTHPMSASQQSQVKSPSPVPVENKENSAGPQPPQPPHSQPQPSTSQQQQQQQHQSAAQPAIVASPSSSGGDKRSPREADQVMRLIQFHSTFKLAESSNESAPVEGAQAPAGQPATTEAPTTKTSTLNPNAVEFKPRQVQQPLPPVNPISSPAPAGTPPAQQLRQSPGMISQQTVVYAPAPAHFMQKIVANQQQPRKRVTVSVDPVVLAQSATGPPLTLGAHQTAASMQQNYVYVPQNTVLPQQYHPIRVVQAQIPQGPGLDPTLGATGQQPHHVQPFIMTQQPVPAHMQTQALTQSMAQPAHTLSNLHQHQHQMPPHQSMAQVSQSSGGGGVNPMPAASPVQHMGGNGHSHTHTHTHAHTHGPQINHNQSAPPTSNTPQAGMFGPQMTGIMPPQGAAGQAVPAHTGTQGPTLFFPPGATHHQMAAAGNVNFTQAGATGPAPAHLQQSGHVNQTQHLVMMPNLPVNQGLNPQQQQQQQHQHQHHSHHHHHTPHHQQQHQGGHQHHTPQPHTHTQFQHVQAGTGNQMQMGQNQHLLQGNMPTASGMGMPHMHPYPMHHQAAMGYRGGPTGGAHSQRGAQRRAHSQRGAQRRAQRQPPQSRSPTSPQSLPGPVNK